MPTSPAPDLPAPPGMCPGIAVKGGGGGAGDGSGSGDASGEGAGGGGSGSGEGGAGDGKGAGSCGPGAAGGCTNCKPHNSAGDPVDVASGKVFTERIRDLFLPGYFNLDLLRSYSTTRTNIDLGLGRGWQHSLGWELEEHGRELHLLTGDGRAVDLPKPPVNGEVVEGGWGVLGFETHYVVRPGNDFLHEFAPLSAGDRRHRLRRVQYRHFGDIRLEYEDDRLAKVTDTVGRTILFHAAPDGRHIGSISVPSPEGPSVVFVRFEYDAEDRLVAAIDADGNTTRYGYDDRHRLVRLEYPTGLVIRYVYDDDGRAKETWGEYHGRDDPALAPHLPQVLADGQTPARGILHCKLDYGEGYTEVCDSVGLRRFFDGPGGQAAKAISAAGGVTTRTFDAEGRMSSLTDPAGGLWQYEYDATGNVTRETDPESRSVSLVRDEAGRELEVVDPAGGKTTFGYDAQGNLQWVRDPAGAVETFQHDARGLVVSATDARGGQHQFRHDAHGNRIGHGFPSGSWYGFEYDWWGRRIRETDPLGAETRYQVSAGGLLLAITDALGRTTRFARNGIGDIVTTTRADGSVVRFEYGGNRWLCRVTDADGSIARSSYNREGWLIALENAKGERHEVEYRADGAPVRERFFHGQTIRYGYDAFGRLLWTDDGAGRIERTLSPVGRLLAEEGPDGATRSYRYDARGELIEAREGDVAFEWTRDPLGRIAQESFVIEGHRYEVQGSLTAAGDRTGFRTSLGLEATVHRDANGRVVGVAVDGADVVSITRNELGLPTRTDFPLGGAIVQRFDAARRLRQRSIVEAATAPPITGEPQWVGPGAPGRQQVWEYSPVDEITSVSSTDGQTVELEYDVRRHLRQRKVGHSVERFGVDAASDYYEEGPDAPARRYGAGSQLLGHGHTSFEYDARGYLQRKQRQRADGAAEVTRYHWTDFGLLGAVELPDGRRVELGYDPFARRVSKRVLRDGEVLSHKHYVWDLVSLVHEVELATSEAGATAAATYLYEDNDWETPLAHRRGAGWVHYVTDANGTPEQLLDETGKLVGKHEWSAFGRTTLAPGSRERTPFRFRGQIEDEETGLHYNRYRYFDPEIGRYISPDPIGLEGGTNLYGYGPNPVGWADPMGWKHYMSVSDKDNSGFSDSGMRNAAQGTRNGKPYDYVSGSADRYCCPSVLETQPKCHTEQKFAHDLMKWDKDQKEMGEKGAKGKRYELSGQYPPCPRCHTAMMRAAKETGAKITYKWKGSSITYDGRGGDVNVKGSTKRAQGLVKAYSPTEIGDANLNPQGGKARSAADTWGYQPAPGADAAYKALSPPKK